MVVFHWYLYDSLLVLYGTKGAMAGPFSHGTQNGSFQKRLSPNGTIDWSLQQNGLFEIKTTDGFSSKNGFLKSALWTGVFSKDQFFLKSVLWTGLSLKIGFFEIGTMDWSLFKDRLF